MRVPHYSNDPTMHVRPVTFGYGPIDDDDDERYPYEMALEELDDKLQATVDEPVEVPDEEDNSHDRQFIKPAEVLSYAMTDYGDDTYTGMRVLFDGEDPDEDFFAQAVEVDGGTGLLLGFIDNGKHVDLALEAYAHYGSWISSFAIAVPRNDMPDPDSWNVFVLYSMKYFAGWAVDDIIDFYLDGIKALAGFDPRDVHGHAFLGWRSEIPFQTMFIHDTSDPYQKMPQRIFKGLGVVNGYRIQTIDSTVKISYPVKINVEEPEVSKAPAKRTRKTTTKKNVQAVGLIPTPNDQPDADPLEKLKPVE